MTNSQSHDFSSRKQTGFTLIELVIVMIILGILAVVTAPQFIDLQSDAHASSMQGVAAAISSGKTMVYSACVISTSCDETAPAGGGNGSGNSITVQGESIILAYGYPRHELTGIARLINIKDAAELKITDYKINGRDGLRIRPDADYAVNKCEIRYSQPLAEGEYPLVEIDIDDC